MSPSAARSRRGRRQALGDLDFGAPGIGDVDDPQAGRVRAGANGGVGFDSRRLQLGDEGVDVPHLKANVIHGAAFGWGLGRIALSEGNLGARDIRRIVLRALAGRGPEVLDVPLLRRQRIRNEQMNVVHLDGRRYGLVFVDLDADVVGTGEEALPGILGRLVLEAGSLPLGDGSVEIFDEEAEVVDHRSHGAAAAVLLSQQYVDTWKLHHHELFPIDDCSANLGPEMFLGRHIRGVDVNVTDGDAGGIGRGELSQGGGGSKYCESNEGSSGHSHLAYNEFASSKSTPSSRMVANLTADDMLAIGANAAAR